MTVMAAKAWTTNAHLILDVATLGYLNTDDLILDPTFGKGTWWNKWRPERLITHRETDVDFRALPYRNNTFDAVTYDPPYVCIGGRTTTQIPEFHERFGMTDAPRTPSSLQTLINDGLTEVTRVTKPRGIILVKCQDYVSSGKLWLGTHHTLTHALALTLECVDRFEHIGHPRPQPPRDRQVHARRNLSTLFVFRTRA